MSEVAAFEPRDGTLVLDLDGFEGPIDLLLSLAREQKVDLARISILDLANQFLSFVERRRSLRLEVAADYLVMAAWLAYLKSRLLLPDEPEEEPSAEVMAAALARQLQRLETIQNAATRLRARPRLDEDVFGCGAPEGLEVVGRVTYLVTVSDLLTSYVDRRKPAAPTTLTIHRTNLHTIEAALERLQRMVGRLPDWQTLQHFVPPGLEGIASRSAIASTLVAALELARSGVLDIRQDQPFGPLYFRRTRPTVPE